ncbi:MAG: hypothetical protein ACRC06_16035 [Waterburya sp.]
MATSLNQDPGATFLTAFDIGILNGNINYTNSLDNTDETDIYKFSLTQTSQIELLIETNSLNSISVDLFVDKNNNGDVDTSESILPYTNYAGLGADADIKPTLGAGTYLIRLNSYSSNSNYSLNLNATPALASTEKDPGNTLSNSLSLGHLYSNRNNQQITEFLGNVDQVDIYRFSMDKGQLKFNIGNLTGKELGGTIHVDLIKDNNNNGEIDINDTLFYKNIEYHSWDDDNYTVDFDNKTFDSGNYFVRFQVSEYDDHTNTNYTFSLSSSSENTPSSDNTTIYRFFRPDKGAHFYTASATERDYVSQNLPQYQYEGASYQAVPEDDDSLTGAKPVYRFFNRSTGVHLYTMSEGEKDYIIDNLANYSFENIAYYAYENPQEGAVPLYRFYHTLADTHFFTPSVEERNSVKENLPWYQEEGNQGIAFYVEPLDN